MACSYGPPQNGNTIILVERGKQQTISSWADKQNGRPSSRTRNAVDFLPSRLTDDTLCFLRYFDIFVRSNNFTGKGRTFGDEVKQLAGLHSTPYLMNAMISLGAVQAAKLKATDVPSRKTSLASALEYYAKAITGLREAINALEKDEERLRNTVLWTTLFLGLFELINDETGHGWERHMLHGTAKALEASGPASCRAGPSREFFIHARVFEVSRTILSNESTFLTQPEWVDLSRHMWMGEDGYEWRPLDSLLDIMAMASSLRVRVSSFIVAQESSPDSEPIPEAHCICADGFSLQVALNSWYKSYALPNDESETPSPSTLQEPTKLPTFISSTGQDQSMLLSRIFFAAISIYLSGVFDYEIIHWQRLGLVPPTLAEQTIQMHTGTILQLSNSALDNTSLSPLLFLFPLRIAGARSRQQWQRDWVAALIGRIGGGFAAAAAIQTELDHVWDTLGVVALDSDPQCEGGFIYIHVR